MAEPAAATLRRAADHLTELATGVTPGPWRTADVEGIFYIASAAHGPVSMDNDNPVCACPFTDDEGVAIERTAEEGGQRDAEWIATVHPGIAAPLAAWLRAEAAHIDLEDARVGSEWERKVSPWWLHPEALDVARALLGEDTDHA